MAAPRPSMMRAPTKAKAAAAAISIGSNTWRNCITPKSNSIWKTDIPMTKPPKARYWMNLMPGPSFGASSPTARLPSCSRKQRGERGEAGAADHHQVGGAPQRDVLAEDAVPDVVEREADQRVQPAAGHQDTADGRVPRAG